MNNKAFKLVVLLSLVLFGYINRKEIGLELPEFPQGTTESISKFKVDKELDQRVKGLGEELKSLCKGLSDLVLNSSNGRDHKQDLLYLGNYYRDYARVIASDKDKIKTTGQIREANVLAGQLMFESLEIKGKYDGLGEKIDGVMKESYGLENRSLDTTVNGKVLRDQVTDTFLAIAEEFYKGI